jgi:uncharacterized membrane protein YfcA
MNYLVICGVAFVVSGLTLFSGFGLGTLLMPAFALFFPVQVAIGATAVVHLVNNIFKVILVGRKADLPTVIKFALPAAIFASFGALLLKHFSSLPPLANYSLVGRVCTVTAVKLLIGLLIFIFAMLEIIPSGRQFSFHPRYIPLGGALSGFFGGISGFQGALRTAFLINTGLPKDVFIGTMVVSAVIVDVSRLLVYGTTFFSHDFSVLHQTGVMGLVIAGSFCAFCGAFIGSRLLTKVTMRTIHLIVGYMLLILGIALAGGVL